jgi:hypothetical protein
MPPRGVDADELGVHPRLDVGRGPEPSQAFVMVLSHGRRPAIVWSRDQPLLSWLHCHNEAYRRLEGVAAVNRIDNVKTALRSGAGAWGKPSSRGDHGVTGEWGGGPAPHQQPEGRKPGRLLRS